ncbi:hypothetical protein KIH27_18090 [Mycobacterium sp. M1]|uniref:Secreted protein n=1 Tax=Mycolicibacter acidiphilus TaxID=2835306 RepID=A0ABS5RMT6_9MYCO|nr:hypothetical protein [Mycolicibacter acidiphilus]MBS9535499.1 hypothetical protein [Mycolicibacter acidiphilus]
MQAVILSAFAAAALVLGAPAALAHADAPPCAAFDTCRYMPNPNYDGPLMPTWDVPGTYGGWTTLPVMCDPATYTCRQYVPGR